MAQIRIEISGVPLAEAGLEALRQRLRDAAAVILGTHIQPDVHVLLGHSPMVIGELEGYVQQALGKAIWRAVSEALPAGIDPTDRGRINIILTPETEREEIECQIRQANIRIWECEAAVKRFGAESERGLALKAEIEGLKAQIAEMEGRLADSA
jgi:hypothetical protein